MTDEMESSENPAESQTEDLLPKSKEIKYKNAGRSTFSQIVAMLVLACLLVDFGLELIIPTIVIGALHKNPDEALNLTDEQASWFGSILYFAHPIGALISGFLQELLGRKRSLLLVNIPMLVAWSTLYLASSVYQLYFVSAALGLCIGFCEAPLHSYIGEMSEPHVRGTLSAMGTASCLMGMLIMYLIGYLVHWRTAALISSFVPVITFLAIAQIPESPTWLVMNGREKEAQKALGWLRGWLKPEEVQEEFQRLLEYTDTKPKSKRFRGSQREKYEMVPTSENGVPQPLREHDESYWRKKFREITNKKLYLPLRMVFIVFFFGTATQLAAMRPFMVGVLKQFGLTVDNYLVLVLISFFYFVGAMMNVIFVRRLGKRRLTLYCQALATLSVLLLGVYLAYLTGPTKARAIDWIPILLFVSLFFASGSSIALIAWQLCAEVFPVEGRGTAQGLVAAWAYLVNFVMSKSYLYLERLVQLKGVFYFYGALSALGFFYYWRYLPETEGKSLDQIETYFTENCDEKDKFTKRKNNRG
nr:PREDICTED: facilitated trehalose transporter Tret1-like isoform X1 [Bemisia tabaci]